MPTLPRETIQKLKALLEEGSDIPESMKWELFPPSKSECDLTYAFKKPEENILADVMAVPLQDIRTFLNGTGPRNRDQWYNRIIWGENLQTLRSLLEDPEVAGKVRLIYIDPPFSSNQEYHGTRDQKAYRDRLAGAEFLEFLRERLVVMKHLLSPDGSIFVHLDQRKSHYVKVLMDEVFGEANFRNEIVLPGRASKNLQQQFDTIQRLNVRHDVLLWYSASPSARFEKLWVDKHNTGNPEGHWHHFWSTADRKTMRYPLFGITPKTGQWTWKKERAYKAVENYQRYLREHGGRSLAEYWRDTGRILEFIRQDEEGKPQYWRPPAEMRLADTVWSGVPVYDNKTGYPTEKHEKLLEQVLELASNQGDLVLDCFAGSGTTAVVAERLGRRWIAIDSGKLSVYTIQKRILNLYKEQPTFDSIENRSPLVLQYSGHYDFASLKDLPWEDWRFFALRLFECTDQRHEVGGLRVDGLKKGDPVHVYDWREHPGVLISEETIADFHRHVGQIVNRLYIIAPYSAFDFWQDVIVLDGVRYITLRIPYSVIHELHNKDFEAVKQADSEAAVNSIQQAYGFTFMETPNVEWEVGVDERSVFIKTTAFSSRARIKGTERPGGFETLALLLVDSDYDGQTFNLTHFIYGKQLEQDNWTAHIPVESIGDKVMAVWIDHHGNETRAVLKRSDFGLPPLPLLEAAAATAESSLLSHKPRKVTRRDRGTRSREGKGRE